MRSYYFDSIVKKRKILEEIIIEKINELSKVFPIIYGDEWEVEINDEFKLKRGEYSNVLLSINGKNIACLNKLDIYTLTRLITALEEFEEKFEKIAKEVYETFLDSISSAIYLEILRREEGEEG